MSDSIPLLELKGITKTFGKLKANDNVNLKIYPGETHALLGENGAGKSTLVKVVYGVNYPDDGQILWEGKQIFIKNPKHARELGIGMIFQHFSLFESLTATENISLVLDEPGGMKKTSAKIMQISEKYGLDIYPDKPVFSLSVGERQRIEIIRCLLQKPRLLIMDEPTSVLTPQEITQLFKTLRAIQSEGCAIFYISHKLEEIKELCHKATILRHGKYITECDPANETPKSMAELMIGRELPPVRKSKFEVTNLPHRLKLLDVSVKSDDPFEVGIKKINFEVMPGEILGIAGVAGNGQAVLSAVLSGEIARTDSGKVIYNNDNITSEGVRTRRKLGISFVPEERLGRGAVNEMSLLENVLLTDFENQKYNRFNFLNYSAAQDLSSEIIKSYDVRTQGTQSEAASLSGGNLQKFIIGREIIKTPNLLIVSSPTWGIDAGAEAYIRQSLIDLSEKGTTIILISQDLEEIMALSNRVGVMFQGFMSEIYQTSQLTHDKIGLLMGGAKIE